MTRYTAILLSVLIVYLVLNMVVAIVVSKRSAEAEKEKGFLNNYFIGGRSMGGLVLAMTLVATFTSASSFIGGPGVAFTKGLSWVYIAIIQVPTAFIILGILGKKFAIISRKTNAVTVTDYLKSRYNSDAVVIISSICLVLFFIAQMMSQFIGGAVLFQTITGLPYVYGLLLFGVVVIAYTAIGGFKAVVTTDTIQGLVMLLGAFIILFTIVNVAGGLDMLIEKLHVANPNWADITSGGSIAKSYALSFWVLVGVGVLGLPQTAVRGMGFKDTKSLHNAIIYGTIVVGFLMLIMHIAGAFLPAVLDSSEFATSDYAIPTFVLKYMNPVVAGLFIAAPLSAIMSTVSSLLILASAAIIKDLYMNYIAKPQATKTPKFEKKIGKLSIYTTFLIGVIVIIFTIYPPDLIVWINLFAMGGLECAFFCPIIFGLYWKKANATGALLSAICSVSGFLIMSYFQISFAGIHAIVPSLTIAIITFIIGSLVGKKPDDETLELYFPK